MDAFELLINEHRKIAEFFEQIENDRDKAMQENIFARIRQELTNHAKFEETFFYPQLSDFDSTKNESRRAFQEHEAIKILLEKLDKMSPDDDEWVYRIKDLKDAVTHHIAEIEDSLFLKIRELLNDEQISLLQKEIERSRQLINP